MDYIYLYHGCKLKTALTLFCIEELIVMVLKYPGLVITYFYKESNYKILMQNLYQSQV